MNKTRPLALASFSFTTGLLVLLFCATPTAADVTSLTIIDVSTGKPHSSLVSGKTYSRTSLPAQMALRAEVDNPSDTASVQFIDGATGDVIKTEKVPPYAIAGDSSGSYKAWNVPIGDIVLEVVQKLKSGGDGKGLKVSFVVTEGGGGQNTATPTPTSTPSPTGSVGGNAITLVWIDAGSNKESKEIVDGSSFTRASLPQELSIRADITPVSGSKNSVRFYVNGKFERQENVVPYAIAGDQGGGTNYTPWTGLPEGDIELKVEQVVSGAVVKSVTIKFTVTDGTPTSTASPTPTPTPDGASPTPESTPSPTGGVGGNDITLVWIDAGSNKESKEIVDGSSFTRASLPQELSIRADITPVSGSKNSVRFYVNGKFERQENVVPYAIAGDQGGGTNYTPWTGLPEGDVELKVEQVVSGAVVKSVTIKFTVTDGTPTSTATPTPTPVSTPPSTPVPGTTVKISFASSSTVDDFITDGDVTFTGSPAPKNSVTSGDIAGTSLNAVYNSHKWSKDFGFSIPVDGPKDVILMFAETYSGACGEGKRVFTATVGSQVKKDIDVSKEAGCNAAYDVLFKDVAPNDKGEITVTLVSSIQNAFIAGIQLVPPGSPVPTEGPSPTPAVSGKARWETLTTDGNPVKRHEACFVMGDDGKGYLVGGRGNKTVSVFDPSTNSWSEKTGPGEELHHMQCLVYKGKIWIGSSWTGSFPKEKNSPLMHIYDIGTDSWSTREGLPEPRRRGGGAFVLHNNKMWLAMGNRGGHGDHATTLGWLDMYDPEANNGKGAWSTVKYPNAPNPRDHTSGGIVNGKLCIAGGRDGGTSNFFKNPVLAVNCYNFDTNSWEVGPDIAQGRAGAAAGTTCDGELMIAGGEGFGKAWNDVSLFDGKNWKEGPPLKQARHGSGLAISSDCTCKKIYIASGSGAQGGSPELLSTEVYLDKGDSTPKCSS